jgi:hypothetical protein
MSRHLVLRHHGTVVDGARHFCDSTNAEFWQEDVEWRFELREVGDDEKL